MLTGASEFPLDLLADSQKFVQVPVPGPDHSGVQELRGPGNAVHRLGTVETGH
jgi:hypothetical protein